MAEMKLVDINDFRDLGYLQELNRCFLHPLGLALVVTKDANGSSTITGVWDCRDDQEGIVFEWGGAPGSDTKSKAEYVASEMADRRPYREKLFGGMIQPLPLESTDDD